jgi:XRE family transcriptional regulator, aerobic/anaerobic benzoate catabolism transcriptional regulator
MLSVNKLRVQKLPPTAVTLPSEPAGRDPLLAALGERVRMMRARKGMTRRALASSSGVSERHLANLESGAGNASIVVLAQVAAALDCVLEDLVSDASQMSAEKTLIQAMLAGKSEEELHRARLVISDIFGEGGTQEARRRRIALIGLRGAGKSSQGRQLAEALGVPFVELTKEIERVAGCSLAEIQSLLGQAAYRRYERRALQEVLRDHADVVIATPGGIVSDASTFKLLLSECLTVWLQASPAEHMQRVVKQGDLRPMAGNREAMEDLQRILTSRSSMYGKAELALDTSGKSQAENFADLLALVNEARGS